MKLSFGSFLLLLLLVSHTFLDLFYLLSFHLTLHSTRYNLPRRSPLVLVSCISYIVLCSFHSSTLTTPHSLPAIKITCHFCSFNNHYLCPFFPAERGVGHIPIASCPSVGAGRHRRQYGPGPLIRFTRPHAVPPRQELGDRSTTQRQLLEPHGEA